MNSIVLYLLVVLVSFGIAFITYASKNRKVEKENIVLFILRFLVVFLILLLLVNPKITQIEHEISKPFLVVMADDSKSIKNLQQEEQVLDIVKKIQQDKRLLEKFDIEFYSFSKDITLEDSLQFDKNYTDIYTSLDSYDKIYKNNIAPSILITDGNQTLGNTYARMRLHQNVYPIIVGDTAHYEDVSITHLNVNKYAYLKNKFPVEFYVNYSGNVSVPLQLTVFEGKQRIYSSNVVLDSKNNSKKIEFFVKANKVGVHTYTAVVSALKNEKNKKNNTNNFSVEIIDEQSEILLVSDILHPDIGMLKRSIESNIQRKVKILKPEEVLELVSYPLVILYQPTSNFKTVFSKLQKTKNNLFILTGLQTDWDFLNNNQAFFSKNATNKKEDYLANYNAGYTTFLVDDLGFANFSPINDFFGKIDFKVPFQSVLFQNIEGFSSANPLLATFEQGNRRGALLLGENSWRWRMSSKIEEKSFQAFDEFINKLIQYLSSNKRAQLVEIYNKPIFHKNETVLVNAKFYDANYVFNSQAKLWIELTHKETKEKLKYPFALKNNKYEVQISEVKEGDYTFVVFDELQKSTAYGSFKVLDYNLEQQFSNANKKDLEDLVIQNNGKVSYPDRLEELISDLIENKEYLAIQKSKEITKPLIDWKWILGLVILLLSVEWFLRKYRGYI